MKPWFLIGFVNKESLVNQTFTPIHSIQSHKQKQTVESLSKDGVCDLIMETKIIEKVGLVIFAEKPAVCKYFIIVATQVQ